ncbi:MAG: biotin--[acetyl-CoA-carboxylase] ligase, partial [Ignavibacteriaceae bacterium]|nr:biotin--[acetyl-CoA-carboxylase] ligase [Ignavibacteriaceae bacterium]
MDFETFDIKLDTEYTGRNFIYLEEIDSTNTFLLSQQDLKHGTVAFAENQTNGRGRLDRKWISQPGVNLLFSIFLNPSEIDVKKIQLYNLATSLSIAFSIENLLQIPTNLKWPNDVLIGKKKVSGILLESSSLGEKFNKIVVGVGVNVNQPYFQGKYLTEPTSLKLESKQLVSREKLFAE